MAAPIGPEDIRTVAEAALDLAGADGVEVLLMHEWGGLTRFANSSIHQSTWREDTGLRVRVVSDDRLGVAAGVPPEKLVVIHLQHRRSMDNQWILLERLKNFCHAINAARGNTAWQAMRV